MPIEKNNEDLWNLYFGEQEIKKVMYGETLVWENNRVINLGLGKRWNIAELYPNLYKKLTLDNFYVLSMNSFSGNDRFAVTETGVDVGYLNVNVRLAKKYNQNTGILEMYGECNEGKGDVIGLIVTKPLKLIEIGLGTSFDIASLQPSLYNKLSLNNFIIKTIPNDYAFRSFRGSAGGPWTVTCTESLVKEYDSNSGRLDCYIQNNWRETYLGSGSNRKKILVYLCLGKVE